MSPSLPLLTDQSQIIISCRNRWTHEGPFWIDLLTSEGSWYLSVHKFHEQAVKRAARYADKHNAIIIDNTVRRSY